MDSIHYLLMKTHLMLFHRVTARIGEFGLTPGQPKVLDYLASHGEADQSTIAKGCQIEKATIGSILERMEKKGLIRRERHENNRRSIFVTLTPEGERTAQALQEVFSQAERPVNDALSDEELAQLKALLEKAAAAIEAADD